MQSNKILIIAEAGVNHNGNIKTAKKLIDVASESGADIVKFQTFKAHNLLTKKAPKAIYQKKITNKKESQYKMIQDLELSYKDHIILINHCKKRNIEFLSTPFDLESIDLLISLKLKRLKIPSSEINNYIYLERISKFKGNIILSTGMSTIKEISEALKILYKGGVKKNKISILHCNSEYPTPFEDVNLNAMLELKKKFNTNVGYSDHTLGIQVPIIASVLGASIIEKHFTLDLNMKGPDHQASLTPLQLKEMVQAIKNINKVIGSKNKKISKSEGKNIKIARKSLVAITNIKKGEKFSRDNISAKRPGTGISPMMYLTLLGKKSKNNYRFDDLIKKNEL